jgi:hypothetical protein
MCSWRNWAPGGTESSSWDIFCMSLVEGWGIPLSGDPPVISSSESLLPLAWPPSPFSCGSSRHYQAVLSENSGEHCGPTGLCRGKCFLFLKMHEWSVAWLEALSEFKSIETKAHNWEKVGDSFGLYSLDVYLAQNRPSNLIWSTQKQWWKNKFRIWIHNLISKQACIS